MTAQPPSQRRWLINTRHGQDGHVRHIQVHVTLPGPSVLAVGFVIVFVALNTYHDIVTRQELLTVFDALVLLGAAWVFAFLLRRKRHQQRT
jgi:positive regulator of sigma E activity